MFLDKSMLEEKCDNGSTFILKFGSNWCVPCKTVDKILETLSDQVDIIKVDVDSDPDLAGDYEIMSIPTTFVIKDGIIEETFVGVMNINELKEVIV
jgi:thioredoxin 1